MRDRILAILKDIREDVNYEGETRLIDDNILESFDIIEIISRLNEEFDIEFSAKDITAENFNSLDALEAIVTKLSEDEE